MTVDGSAHNFKITTEEDMKRASLLLGGDFETRTGQGIDVHAFAKAKGRHQLMLCGVKVPHPRRLEGHSDADVGLHALTDALLGAMAREDIGVHFSPKDKRWKGADSAVFLEHALKILHEGGGRLVHADITFIGEEPKIAPHREAMRYRLSEIMGMALPRISVKATTTEGLGFLGRKEGLAAEALVTIEWPRS
jgi:2-C-methyl-D-erythritol 4-phosphate cytidylyltransferase/2-C-methyl-D-erythritol 2,4-cyclodiphosphate synthase